MPIVELPTALESALGASLKEKLLKTWKITEETQNAVVVIKLTAVHTPGTAIESQRDSAATHHTVFAQAKTTEPMATRQEKGRGILKEETVVTRGESGE